MACKHWQGDARDAPPGAFSSDGLFLAVLGAIIYYRQGFGSRISWLGGGCVYKIRWVLVPFYRDLHLNQVGKNAVAGSVWRLARFGLPRSSSSTIAFDSSISSGSGSRRPPALTSMPLCLSWSAPLVRRSSLCGGGGGVAALVHMRRLWPPLALCRAPLPRSTLPFEGLCTPFAAPACLCRRAR
jgi:hypothetical protein